MLYNVREENGKFNLYLQKKNGFRFKKSFRDSQSSHWFIKSYLRLCCLSCKVHGLVYKTRDSGGIHGGGNRHGQGNRGPQRYGRPEAENIVSCPECRAKHRVIYNDNRVVLELIPGQDIQL